MCAKFFLTGKKRSEAEVVEEYDPPPPHRILSYVILDLTPISPYV
jgi:hypothetical protein